MDSAKNIKITAIAASHGANSFYLYFLTPIIPIIAKELRLFMLLPTAFFNFPFHFWATILGDGAQF